MPEAGDEDGGEGVAVGQRQDVHGGGLVAGCRDSKGGIERDCE